MERNGLVSIIIPVFNRSGTIERSVRSVLFQTYKNFELIIVDDCSTDDSLSVIKKFKDDRIRLICHKENKGACAARNTGISLAHGDYIAFNDSDDEWRKNKLELQLECLHRNNADVVFCQIKRHNYPGGDSIFPSLKEGYIPYEKLIIKSKCSTQTILAKKKVFNKFLFDESLPRMQDYDFVIRSAREFKYFFIQECLVDVYLQSDSITSMNHGKLLEICSMLLKKHTEVCKEYPQFEIFLLDSIGYFKVEYDENAFPIYKRIFMLDKSMKNFAKMILSKTGILKKLWFDRG